MISTSAVRGAVGEHRGVDSWLDANAAVITLGLVGVNLVLKLALVSEQGLWFDEATSLSHLRGPFDLARSLATDATPPLYPILLYGWSLVFGPSLEAARSLSVLASSLTAGALFWFGRRFLDARTGLFAAILFTISRTHLYFGHEARAYALVGLLCVASFHVFCALLEEPTRRRVGLAALLSAALLYTHYMAVFALCAELLAALCLVDRRSRAMRAYVLSQVLAAVLFLPWVFHLLVADDPLPMSGWLGTPTPADAFDVLASFVGSPLLVAIYAGLIAAAVLLGRLGRADFDRSRVTVLALWAFAPLALDYGVSFAVPSFLYRYLLYASLGLYLLVAYLLCHLALRGSGRIALFLLILLPSAWAAHANPVVRPDWRGAAAIALKERDHDTLTIVSPPYELLPFAYHYSREAFDDPPHLARALRGSGVHGLVRLDGLAASAAGHARRVVVVSAQPLPGRTIREDMAAAGFALARTYELPDIEVQVFETTDSPAKP